MECVGLGRNGMSVCPDSELHACFYDHSVVWNGRRRDMVLLSPFLCIHVLFPECVAKGSRLTLGVWG